MTGLVFWGVFGFRWTGLPLIQGRFVNRAVWNDVGVVKDCRVLDVEGHRNFDLSTSNIFGAWARDVHSEVLGFLRPETTNYGRHARSGGIDKVWQLWIRPLISQNYFIPEINFIAHRLPIVSSLDRYIVLEDISRRGNGSKFSESKTSFLDCLKVVGLPFEDVKLTAHFPQLPTIYPSNSDSEQHRSTFEHPLRKWRLIGAGCLSFFLVFWEWFNVRTRVAGGCLLFFCGTVLWSWTVKTLLGI